MGTLGCVNNVLGQATDREGHALGLGWMKMLGLKMFGLGKVYKKAMEAETIEAFEKDVFEAIKNTDKDKFEAIKNTDLDKFEALKKKDKFEALEFEALKKKDKFEALKKSGKFKALKNFTKKSKKKTPDNCREPLL